MAPARSLGATTAERVRSTCARESEAVLAIDGSSPTPVALHHVCADGEIAVTVDADSTAATLAWLAGASGIPTVLELADHSPLDLRERVRSLVWVSGTLLPVCDHHARDIADGVAADYPSPELLDIGHGTVLLVLRPHSVVVADSAGAEPVSLDDLLAAEADPFCDVESSWLRHLDEDHPELVAMLSRKLPPHLRRGRVRPLEITRHGLSLRIEHPGVERAGGAAGDTDAPRPADNDVFLPFQEPVTDALSMSRAIRTLVGCPFVNGLRARTP
ncbi:DUF2470 domain-containing protein [Rhodococcus rhodnii]|uniref:DUF2470 domain-containing protein n=2 Tax=Rhodococcus rhodnii TaxID=38312 RepID=R7WLS4_9NOCA|nr:DUF2470 domain-containing protein [Rhodococcus rhodnii]EOM76247.1 hypothetical protein Rrhod_2406 [Rhodococcus rhodnii LMG 5362]TXG89532.1 DUF2470 domain-containing protein [Rhodococcus rhodnii]